MGVLFPPPVQVGFHVTLISPDYELLDMLGSHASATSISCLVLKFSFTASYFDLMILGLYLFALHGLHLDHQVTAFDTPQIETLLQLLTVELDQFDFE